MQLLQQTQVQKVWGWKIAAYLFGAGMGAGAYVMGAAAILMTDHPSHSAATFAMALGTALVLLSVPFLIWDLERPMGFLRVLVKARNSWLSRGAYILMSFGLLAVINLVIGAPVVMTAISGAAAVAVAGYTGLLIGTMMARPIWNTPALPVLFLVSALSTGVSALAVGGLVAAMADSTLYSDVEKLLTGLRSTHLLLLIAELLVLYFYMTVVSSRTPESTALMLKGQLSGLFWTGVVVVGLVLPIALESLVVVSPAMGGTLEIISALCVLAGGFCLRRVILAAGTRARVTMGVPFVIRPEV